jgi:hypothetical protein
MRIWTRLQSCACSASFPGRMKGLATVDPHPLELTLSPRSPSVGQWCRGRPRSMSRQVRDRPAFLVADLADAASWRSIVPPPTKFLLRYWKSSAGVVGRSRQSESTLTDHPVEKGRPGRHEAEALDVYSSGVAELRRAFLKSLAQLFPGWPAFIELWTSVIPTRRMQRQVDFLVALSAAVDRLEGRVGMSRSSSRRIAMARLNVGRRDAARST